MNFLYDAETLISVCQCVPRESDSSLPVWPCGMPALLKLEAAYEQATHYQLPVYVIMCVSKGVCRCYCWNIKVLP